MVTRVRNTTAPQEFVTWLQQDDSTTSGLTFGYKSGDVFDGGTLTTIPAGTVALTDGAVNIVYIDFSSTPAIAVALDTAKPVQADSVFLYVLTTLNGQIIDTVNLNNWLVG